MARREVLSLGAVSLSGPLRAYDPVGVPSRAVQLPVIVEAGNYPAFVLLADEADLLVIRFGGGRPSSWQEVVRPDGSDEYVPIEAAPTPSHRTRPGRLSPTILP